MASENTPTFSQQGPARRYGQETAPIETASAQQPPTELKDPLIWIDCEMTGLDPDTDVIIEIYCLITTADLDLVDETGFGVVVHQPAAVMAVMGEWCTRTHRASGLTAAVAASTTSPADAATQLLAYIRRHVPARGAAILAGNSIHTDRSFLRRPPYNVVTDHLHYRLLDISSIKEAARRWSPRAIKKLPSKKGMHKARDDILESIEEAKFYRDMIFRVGEEAAVERKTRNKKHKT